MRFCQRGASKRNLNFLGELKNWECIQILFQRIRMAGVRSEDELGVKWDRCLADTGIKLLGGDV